MKTLTINFVTHEIAKSIMADIEEFYEGDIDILDNILYIITEKDTGTFELEGKGWILKKTSVPGKVLTMIIDTSKINYAHYIERF